MSDKFVNLEEKLSRCVRTQNELIRIWFAEFLGTFLLCLIGNGSVHQELGFRKMTSSDIEFMIHG